MRAWMYQLARCAVLVTIMTLQPSAPAHPDAPSGEDPTAALEQVRLRKLHLVRPDLIPYPISFEVYC